MNADLGIDEKRSNQIDIFAFPVGIGSGSYLLRQCWGSCLGRSFHEPVQHRPNP